MTRWIWIWRAIGVLMLLAFMILFANLQRRLTQIQGSRPPAASPTR